MKRCNKDVVIPSVPVMMVTSVRAASRIPFIFEVILSLEFLLIFLGRFLSSYISVGLASESCALLYQ